MSVVLVVCRYGGMCSQAHREVAGEVCARIIMLGDPADEDGVGHCNVSQVAVHSTYIDPPPLSVCVLVVSIATGGRSRDRGLLEPAGAWNVPSVIQVLRECAWN